MNIRIISSAGYLGFYNEDEYILSIPKTSYVLRKGVDLILLEYIKDEILFELDLTTTIDGESFSDLDSLKNKLESFRNGGGSGSGATWGSITGDIQSQSDLISLLAGIYRVMPSVETTEDLPLEGNRDGDVRNVIENDMNYVWIEEEGVWDALAGVVDLSNYYNKSEIDLRLPILTNGNFLVGGASGNEQRGLLGTDMGLTGGARIPYWTGSGWTNNGLIFSSNPLGGSTVARTTGANAGRGKFNPAIDADDAVVLSQVTPSGLGMNPSGSSSTVTVPIINGSTNSFTTVVGLASGTNANTLALRYTAGRLRVGEGVEIADAINLGQLNTAISNLRVGQNGGVATLDPAGKIPMEQLNVSGLQFKGAWNPNTNIPNIVDGTGAVGDFYKASHAGSHNSGNGNYTYVIGDWVIYAGGTWQRIGSADTVTMVNGKLGAVVINKNDIGLGNTDNTSDANKPVSIAQQQVLNQKQNTLVSGTNIKTVAGYSLLGTGNIDLSGVSPLISSTVQDGFTINEYGDRIEYLTKIQAPNQTIGTGGARYGSHTSTVRLPDGVSISGADWAEISIRNINRTLDICVYDNSSRYIVLGYFNNYNDSSSVVANPTVFIKLTNYK